MRLILFRLIGILEVGGGLYGMASMLHRLLPPGPFHTALPALIAFALYAFVLVAGVLLLEGSDRGVHLSSIAQLLQLPLIATPILSYGLYCGGFINVFATLHLPPHLALDWHFVSEGFVLALAGPAVSRLGINLLALLSWLALRLR
ncbi:MAG: hypothetical protein WA777_16430 [Rhodanobacter sp.]